MSDMRDMERRHSTPRLDATERPSACYRATVFRATVFETEASRPCYRLRDGSFELLCGGAGRRPDGRGAEVGGGDAVAARHGHSSAPLGAAATRRTVSRRAHPRQTPLILALCLLPATCALAPPVRQESAMGVNEHGAYDFHARARRMPPPIPMPPRSFFEGLSGMPWSSGKAEQPRHLEPVTQLRAGALLHDGGPGSGEVALAPSPTLQALVRSREREVALAPSPTLQALVRSRERRRRGTEKGSSHADGHVAAPNVRQGTALMQRLRGRARNGQVAARVDTLEGVADASRLRQEEREAWQWASALDWELDKALAPLARVCRGVLYCAEWAHERLLRAIAFAQDMR
eukprot:Tamp_22379.p1 GENE.Tamp_22379~~Tamp_22379.p1  ORF type:complete len:347 (-),score=39.91 Tamp_22379:51-1091(-)